MRRIRFFDKGFTLVELIIVLAILALIAIAVLLALNPGEAQRKARDDKRLKDAQTLIAILQQFNDDGFNVGGSCTGLAGCASTGAPAGQQPCATNWLLSALSAGDPAFTATHLCSYTNAVPTDPRNGESTTVVNDIDGDGIFDAGETATATPAYTVKMQGSDYEINVIVESPSNISKLTNDGGDSVSAFEAGTNLRLF